jgi:hypothetical protein
MPEELEQDREVDYFPEGVRDGLEVGPVAVCGELDSVRHPPGQILHEDLPN